MNADYTTRLLATQFFSLTLYIYQGFDEIYELQIDDIANEIATF